jgi:hypothetical protein
VRMMGVGSFARSSVIHAKVRSRLILASPHPVGFTWGVIRDPVQINWNGIIAKVAHVCKVTDRVIGLNHESKRNFPLLG